MRRSFLLLIGLLLLVAGCKEAATGRVTIERNVGSGTFLEKEGEICMQDGKPVIRMFSTSWCPHCAWIRKTFTTVVSDYVQQGKIVAYEWDVDTQDNLLTSNNERYLPKQEKDIFLQFNPDGSVPTFIFGCKYYRIGNSFEDANDLPAEEQEFRHYIDKTLEQKEVTQ